MAHGYGETACATAAIAHPLASPTSQVEGSKGGTSDTVPIGRTAYSHTCCMVRQSGHLSLLQAPRVPDEALVSYVALVQCAALFLDCSDHALHARLSPYPENQLTPCRWFASQRILRVESGTAASLPLS